MCELSKEVSDVLNNASTIAKNACSSTVESEFVLKSLLTSGLLRGKVSQCIPLGTESLARELDGYIRRKKYSNNDSRVGAVASSALLYAQSLALSRNKAVGPSELVEGLVKYDTFLQGIKHKRSQTDAPNESTSVDNYLLDLTKKARDGCLGRIVGRELEVERLKVTLGRMRKSNVLIVGAAGVGKTALVERLALDLLDEDDSLTVLSLDLCGFYSGQGTRGELESKLRAIFDRIKGGKTILFIDEIHHLIQNQEGGLNVTNLFKPIMTSGEVKIIGSTTVKEYHQYFRRDRAFERRFEVLRLHENTVDESLVILHGVRPELEAHHKVEISDDAILSAVTLTRRFIPRRTLPDKALDVLDEAAMLVRKSASSQRRPHEELTRRKNRLIVDILHNGDPNAKKRAELAAVEALESDLRASFAAQRGLRQQLRELQELQHDYEKGGNLLKASELHNHTIPELVKSLEGLERESESMLGNMQNSSATICGTDGGNKFDLKELADSNTSGRKMRIITAGCVSGHSPPLCVDQVAVAEVVSRQAGIPVGVLLQSHKCDYKKTLDELRSVVPGQDDAVRVALLHFYRRIYRLTSSNKVGGAMCFIGPTGVGKRTLLRHISGIFGLSLKHISCSQLHASNATNILVGSPPGYVGHREGGVLSEWMKESPYSIVVFDKADLMHVNVLNLLTNAIEKGCLIDSQGEECRLDQCFFVFTYTYENLVHPIIKDHVEDVIVFNELNARAVEMLVKSKLSMMPLVNLRYTEAAVGHICTKAKDMGSVLKFLDHAVVSWMCCLIVSGKLSKHEPCTLLLRSEIADMNHALHLTDELSIVPYHVRHSSD